ncbi:MAG: GGDEF domain-containing protein [Victivallaceae bacterium]|nr:GGDEF domain-containing protein [Victivallaceae bacterium]
MSSQYEVLSEIIELCLGLDRLACSIYRKFALSCRISALAAEWEAIADEELEHLRFWKKALTISRKKHLPLIFENAGETRDKLRKINKAAERITSNSNACDSLSERFTLAFLIEIYMLDPIFMTLFHHYNFIAPDIENKYEKHILRFTGMVKRYRSELSTLHIELFNETLYDLYCLSRDLCKNALYDNLTGFYNRHGFFRNIKPLLSLAERKKMNIGIIMIDFDNFREINNSFGHQAGDAALKAAAAIIKANIRQSCIPCRYGGDEFIVFAAIEDKKSLELICERIVKSIDKRSEEVTGIHFTVSAGAWKGKVGRQPEEILATIIRNADENLFKVKKSGRNNYLVDAQKCSGS